MRTLKILGAGSIGNHLAHAARRLGWSVTLCDVDPSALERTRSDIYPGRYGAFDESIHLCSVADAPRSGFDVIAIGTPPDSHVGLAIDALAEGPSAILVEKPLCGPGLERAQELAERAAERGVAVFVAYNHAVGEVAVRARELAGQLGPVETLDVEFREHWGGIFAAHPWLAGPGDSYLGHWRRGGGASGEHSHAIHLWQNLAHCLGAGRVSQVDATLEYVLEGDVDYDKLCLLNLRTESGLVGRVVQDVVTSPARKWARVQAREGHLEFTLSAAEDLLGWQLPGAPTETQQIQKARPDDFIAELRYVDAALSGQASAEDLDLERGLEAMLVVAAAHRSAELGRRVEIEYAKGCTPDALRPL